MNWTFQYIARQILSIVFILVTTVAVAGGQETVQNNTTDPGIQLTAFNAAISNKKIALYWVTGMENDFSHFVIERSNNGVEYKDAAIIFANGNSTSQQGYFFADAVNTNTKAVYHYRLRMVSAGGKYTYSAACVIKTGEKATTAQLQVHPNPVVNELRITIPEAWKNAPVSYEVYNGNGQLIKRLVTQARGQQNELINMQAMVTGVYMIRAFTETDTAVQWIMKK